MSELKITGNPTPTVGKAEFYSVNQLLSNAIPTKIFDGSKPNAFEYPVEWSVHILENGRWIQKEENDKTGNKVSYTFIQKSLERKGIRILAKRGNQVARLDIKPHRAESPKIDSIEFLDRNGNKPTKPFAYGQTLKARVHCLHMEKRTVYATLWEDDAAGAGHDKANEKNKMKTLPGTVKGGIADIDFVLEPDFAKIANAIKAKGDSDEGKTHEYYVTAEILNKKTASKNTNVANPNYKDTTTTTKPAAPKKETPAQKKGPSKKQEKEKEKEKSIGDGIIDWLEGILKVNPIVAPNPEAPTGNNPLKTGEPDKNPKEEKKEKNGACVCKDYDLIWGGHPNITCDFRKKVVEISIRQNFDPNHLMAVMWVESAKTFSTSLIALKPTGKFRPNGKPKLDYRGLTKSEINDLPEIFEGGIGLIQFTPAAITGLNNYYGLSLTKKKLAVMTQLDQLDYVEKYIALWKKTNGINSKLTLADLYLLVFAPSKMNGSDDNTTLYEVGTEFYNANASVDTDGKNGITKKEIADRAYKSLDEGSKKENKESIFECITTTTTNPVENINETGFYIYKNGDIKYIKTTNEVAYYVQVKDGANDFKKVITLTKNTFGLVKFPNSGNGFNRYGGVDTGGKSKIEDVGAGDHYLLPQTAAALFGVISDVVDKNWEVHFGDMSSENGSDPTSTPSKAKSHHAGHGHKGKQSGLNADFRYLNKKGTSFQGVSSSTEFDDSKNKDFFKIAFKYGFDKNYATGKSYSGVNSKVGGHYDHGHLGTLSIDYTTVEKIDVKIIQ